MKVTKLKIEDFAENLLNKKQQQSVVGGWGPDGPPPTTGNGDIKDPEEETPPWID